MRVRLAFTSAVCAGALLAATTSALAASVLVLGNQA
jgi:hypothetical protein